MSPDQTTTDTENDIIRLILTDAFRHGMSVAVRPIDAMDGAVGHLTDADDVFPALRADAYDVLTFYRGTFPVGSVVLTYGDPSRVIYDYSLDLAPILGNAFGLIHQLDTTHHA